MALLVLSPRDCGWPLVASAGLSCCRGMTGTRPHAVGMLKVCCDPLWGMFPHSHLPFWGVTSVWGWEKSPAALQAPSITSLGESCAEVNLVLALSAAPLAQGTAP